MTDLEKLIEAVEAGTFLMDVLPARNERLAYSAFGGSLDAAKALHDALLPERDFAMMSRRKTGGFTALVAPAGYEGGYDWRRGETPARAWLLAILRAYAARDAA